MPVRRGGCRCSASVFFQAEDGIRDIGVTGVQTCALPISPGFGGRCRGAAWAGGGAARRRPAEGGARRGDALAGDPGRGGRGSRQVAACGLREGGRAMRIHMIGIGGAGMSGIAEVLNSRGDVVTGSDLKESPYTRRLREAGVTVYIGHAAEQVGDAERVVISTAIPKTNPELLEARRRSIPVIPRAEALAWILEGNRSIAVAGTHGKTTTTSMTAHALRALGENPTALVGGELNDIGSNVAFGRADLVVAEADESDRSLLHLAPQAAVVTNIEFDHPDFYSSLEDVVETFGQFVRFLPEDGT